MGTTYEGILAVAGLGDVRAAALKVDQHGLLAPVADMRTALVPSETYAGVSDVETLAEDISAGCECHVLAHGVYDSDLLMLWVYDNGTLVHRYVSEVGALGEVFEDRDGLMKIEFDGAVYLEADPGRPHGPIGLDPSAFQLFAIGNSSLDAILLPLESRDYCGNAERRHQDFLKALNLDSVFLRDRYVHLRANGIVNVVEI